jgi:transposase-like protein
MLNSMKAPGRPPVISADAKVRLVRERSMGGLIKDIAARHGVTRVTVWRWIVQGRDLIRASGQEY